MSDANEEIARKAERAVAAAIRGAKTGQGRSRCEEVELHYAGYAERGYSSKSGLVATGDWNTITDFKGGQSRPVDEMPALLAARLEALGVEIEWSDEWMTCSHCGKLVRSQGDSYGWKPSYVMGDGECTCLECVDPVEHLAALEGNPKSANTIDTIDPAQHGYVLVEAGFENGWHPGQDADPKVIAQALEAQGIERFVFQIDSNGQFDTRFSVYVHQDEAGKLNRQAYEDAPKDGPSVSGAMERGLREATRTLDALQGPGIKYASISKDGVVEARLVSPEEFIEGIGNKAAK